MIHAGPAFWRVGHYADPLGFIPLELCRWSSRFDDIGRRFRSVYVAEQPATCFREMLADLRPNAAAIAAYVAKFGLAAVDDLPAAPVTASWRRANVLAPVALDLDGELVDLCDPGVRADVEAHHVAVLARHGLDHLDLGQITTRRREVTQTIAADLFDRVDAAAVRFPSRLDGEGCIAVLEGRGTLLLAGDVQSLRDPPPTSLTAVCSEWKLKLELTP